MSTFKEHSQTQQASMLARKLPEGDFWAGKSIDGTVINKLLLSLGMQYLRAEGKLNYTADELALTTTNDLIDEWEQEYNIKGSCFASLSAGADLETRINNILTRIAADGTSTEAQFIAVADSLGLTIDIIPGRDYMEFPITFPFTFIADEERDGRFIIVVDLDGVSSSVFPFTFPITFGDARIEILKCFFERLKPANCDVLYVNE